MRREQKNMAFNKTVSRSVSGIPSSKMSSNDWMCWQRNIIKKELRELIAEGKLR